MMILTSAMLMGLCVMESIIWINYSMIGSNICSKSKPDLPDMRGNLMKNGS